MLVRWHYIALLAPLAMMIMEWRRARARVQVVLFIAILLASLQAFADTRIRVIRNDSPAPISSLSPDDPVRRRFGMLHGVSSMLLLAQVLAAAAVVVMSDGQDAPRPAHPQPD
jgi:hypothetical protein